MDWQIGWVGKVARILIVGLVLWVQYPVEAFFLLILKPCDVNFVEECQKCQICLFRKNSIGCYLQKPWMRWSEFCLRTTLHCHLFIQIYLLTEGSLIFSFRIIPSLTIHFVKLKTMVTMQQILIRDQRMTSNVSEAQNILATTVMDDPREEWFKEIITIIRYCFLPIVAVGTCTNILNIIVFSSARMLSQSTANLLLILAISDFGLLYFEVSQSFT